MSIESTRERLRAIERDTQMQNFIAQANARYILFNTAESKENFPEYTIKDEKLELLALYYLRIGCEFAEDNDLESARDPLEKGAAVLEYVHGSNTNKTDLSNVYVLISALAYYVAFQYSKSYILINKTDSENTLLSRLIKLFLQRDFAGLEIEINQLVVDDSYEDSVISEKKNLDKGANKIYEITIAKSLNGFIKYFYTGNRDYLEKAQDNLKILKEIAELRREPVMWWIIRLLLLIGEGFDVASLWNSLGQHFDIENEAVKKYVQALVYNQPRGIYELFITQRKSLIKVINPDNNGCIVTIPTSSGKTRIAEMAILHSIISNPRDKVLYIAPFRSLAFEIENTLENIFSKLDIQISHLYGGALYSKMDEMMIDESSIIIATPEKAKAILRGNKEFAESIKFVIIDEGHLLGADKRLIVNEIFYEELRVLMQQNEGKFLLLSAVLPNAEDLALWLTNSKETIYSDSWRPSDERLGVLDWNGKEVSLNWLSTDTERSSFNKNFIQSQKLERVRYQRVDKFFPGNKNEAVAETAFRLRNFGPVLIFVGIKKSVGVMAKAYVKCLEINPVDFEWKDKSNWLAFELACIEAYGEDSELLDYARLGILCHHGALTSDVRFPLERLMRNDKPLVIISTSTLGQGVNLGVSTVIFSTIVQSGSYITGRDFWNIAGRAGRAFVDHEAKILVVWDRSDNTDQKSIRKYKYAHRKILEYFDKANIDIAKSGILILLQTLKGFATAQGINFEFLLELLAENRIEEIGRGAKDIDETLDWIDDTLLALQEMHQHGTTDNYDWIEDFFTNSLAYIQINSQSNTSKEELVSFFKARTKGIVKKVQDSDVNWQSVIDSGIPLNSNLFLEEKMVDIVDIIREFNVDNLELQDKIDIAVKIFEIISEIPIVEDDISLLKADEFKSILTSWLSAGPYSEICKIAGGEKTVFGLFSYKLPWILNAISKKLRNEELEDEAFVIEELSVLTEIGLPNLVSVKVYRAGLRSRLYAYELGEEIDDAVFDMSVMRCRSYIIRHKEKLRLIVSQTCGKWIELLSHLSRTTSISVMKVNSFNFDGENTDQSILFAKFINGKQYLINGDFSFVHDDSNGKIDFSEVNPHQGIYFEYNREDKVWEMVNDNPYIRVTSNF